MQEEKKGQWPLSPSFLLLTYFSHVFFWWCRVISWKVWGLIILIWIKFQNVFHWSLMLFILLIWHNCIKLWGLSYVHHSYVTLTAYILIIDNIDWFCYVTRTFDYNSLLWVLDYIQALVVYTWFISIFFSVLPRRSF